MYGSPDVQPNNRQTAMQFPGTREAEKVIQQSSLNLPKAYKSEKSRLIAIDISVLNNNCKNSRLKVQADHPMIYDIREFPIFPEISCGDIMS